MLNAFKIKEFNLQPIYDEWKDAPVFNGNTKGISVEEWLDKIKDGCTERGVPEEYWYKVAQHFMGPKAKARLDELKQVITKVHGAKYRWTWKKFRVAMVNMGWSIDMDKKETIKVQGRSSGMWFTRRKDTEASNTSDMPQDPPSSSKPRPPPSRSNTLWITKQPIVEEPEPQVKKQTKANTMPRTRSSRSNTVSGFWPGRMNSNATQSKDDLSVVQRPKHQKTRSETEVIQAKKQKRTQSPEPSTSSTDSHEEVITTKAEAPTWLLNAFTALEYITSEHPKTMSVVSAILITAGSIPAIPVIAAGAGGAVLASSTAHAIGAIAVAAGQALGAGVAHTQKKQSQGHSGSITDGHH